MTRISLTRDQDLARISAVPAEDPLPAPLIPAAADGGLGYYDLFHDPETRLTVQCGPWADLEPGDVVHLFWAPAGTPDDGGTGVAAWSVAEGGNVIIAIPVPSRNIRDVGEGLMDVWYTIRTAFGYETIPSRRLTVRVKFNIPGDRDPEPDTRDINENLAMPVVIPDPVPDGTVSAEVRVAPWKFMTEGDVITLSWGGIPLTLPPLTAGQVGREITFTVTRDTLESGGSGAVPVTYSIRDVVNNWSQFAPYARPDVQIEDPLALEAPELAEAGPDGVLDVTGLSDTDELTTWVPRYAGIAAGDQVVVDWAGRTSAGQAVSWSSPEYTVPAMVPFVIEVAVPASQATVLAGGSLVITYRVVNRGQVSKKLRLTVTGEVQQLLPPAVAEARDGNLDPADTTEGATAIVPPWPGMAIGDTITVFWDGKEAGGAPTYWSARRSVSDSGVGKETRFTVPAAEVDRLNNGSVKLYYQVDTYSALAGTESFSLMATLRSPDLTLSVKGVGAQPDLPAPSVEEAQDGVLEPDLPLATVTVPGEALTAGARVDLVWTGDVSGTHTDWTEVTRPGEAVNFTVPGSHIAPNGQVTVSYRVNGVVSLPLALQVRADLGEPRVKGARSQLGPFYRGSPSYLNISRDETLAGIRWHYEKGEEYYGNTLIDNQPESPLQVSYQYTDGGPWVEKFTLRPGNITGVFSISDRQSGYIIKDDGTVFGWGNQADIVPPANLKNVRYITANGAACAALHQDSTLTCWGDASSGGLTPTINVAIRHIVASSRAFVALLENGSTVAWGNPDSGGTIPFNLYPELHDLIQICGSSDSYAALRRDGEVFCWGKEFPKDGERITKAAGSVRITATNNAFAAITKMSTVVSWGDPFSGGEIPDSIQHRLQNVTYIASTSTAFAAMMQTGEVLSWGEPRFGGDMPFEIKNAKQITGSTTAFAVITQDNSVKAWGIENEGGTVPKGLTAETLTAGYGSFAAIRHDGSVISWGKITGEYIGENALAVYTAGENFVAITVNKKVISWGKDSPELQHLDGLVSQII